jgi:hypothetical protein
METQKRQIMVNRGVIRIPADRFGPADTPPRAEALFVARK